MIILAPNHIEFQNCMDCGRDRAHSKKDASSQLSTGSML
jgi:hypothetical protein